MKYLKTALFTTATCTLIATSNFASDPVVARVNKKEIKMSEVKQIQQSLPKEALEKAKDNPDALTKNLVNQLVDATVLVDAAKKAGLEKTKEVQQAIEKATEQVLVQAFIMEQLGAKVNDQAVEKEYKTLKDKFMQEMKNKKESKVRHILLKDEAAAKAVIKRLEKGEDFQKLARELSEETQSAQDGGDLGYIPEGAIPDFDAALAALKPGEFSKTPTKTQLGYHVFKVDDRRNAKPPKFEDIKPQLTARVQQKEFFELIKRLRDKASIEILFNAEEKK